MVPLTNEVSKTTNFKLLILVYFRKTNHRNNFSNTNLIDVIAILIRI